MHGSSWALQRKNTVSKNFRVYLKLKSKFIDTFYFTKEILCVLS